MRPDGRNKEALATFRRQALGDGAVWVGLLLLVLIALVAAKTMGSIGFVTAIVAALIQAVLLAFLFMRLKEASALVRLAAVLGFALLSAMFALSLADLFTRR